ncbi:MAG: phage tail assembly protein [Pseudomonadota bacterium]|nr:phage tail assembly protein [Pseudomonadota bacterium]
MTNPSDTAAANRFVTITLAEPIRRGETTIEKLTLRKPKSGELRGLSLRDILSSDITATMEIIPRISDPILIKDEVEDLDAEDLAEIGGVIRGFFMTAAEKKAIELYIADHQPKT